MVSSSKPCELWPPMSAVLCGRFISSPHNMFRIMVVIFCQDVCLCYNYVHNGEEETGELLLAKFKWGHSFLSRNRDLLKAYSKCENGTEIINVQNSWLASASSVPKSPVNALNKSHQSTGGGSDDDSDDGLPPLEEKMNHLNLSEDEEESEEESETE